jgi:ribosome-binding factor A
VARRKAKPESLLPSGARPAKRGGQRPAQVADAVRQSIGGMLTGGAIKDPRLEGKLITVTDVEMTPDLRLARVFVSVFPEDEKLITEVMRGLKSARNEIKRIISRDLGLRLTPSLEFRLDPSVAQGARIEMLLREIRDSEGEGEGGEPSDDDGDA